jgi:hypothetical protein
MAVSAGLSGDSRGPREASAICRREGEEGHIVGLERERKEVAEEGGGKEEERRDERQSKFVGRRKDMGDLRLLWVSVYGRWRGSDGDRRKGRLGNAFGEGRTLSKSRKKSF